METGEKTIRPVVTLEPKLHDYETKAQLCVTNETLRDVVGTVIWTLRNHKAEVLQSDSTEVMIPALTSVWLEEMDFQKTDVDNNYMSYEFVVDGVCVSEGTVLFTAPKYFRFIDPELRYEIHEDEITVYANAYAQYVEIDSPDSELILI